VRALDDDRRRQLAHLDGDLCGSAPHQALARAPVRALGDDRRRR
jgi:hypothetical protein